MTITLDLNQFQAKDQNFFTEMLPYVSPAIRNIQRQGDKCRWSWRNETRPR